MRNFQFSALLLLAAAAPAWAGPTLHFASKDGTARVPFTFESNHIFVQVKLGNGASGNFMVDTGADYTLLNAHFAHDAGIKGSGESSIHSAGGSVSMSNAPDQVLQMQGLEVEDGSVVVMDLAHLEPIGGWRIDGVIGNDILRECVVRIDYAAREITFYQPDAYRLPAAAALPMSGTFFGGGAFVPGTLTLPGRAPEEIKFAIDSGASYSSLNTPYVESSGAIQAVGRTVTRAAYGANNEKIESLVGRASGLQLGPYLMAGPVLTFYRTKQGVFASDSFQGVLGNDVLQRFSVTLDYPDKKLVLEPNAGLKSPFRADASGLTLVATGDDLRSYQVRAVDAGTPAADAGMQAGDEIEQVDGAPASSLHLGELKQRLSEDGKEVRLNVRRNGKPLKLTLKLRKLV